MKAIEAGKVIKSILLNDNMVKKNIASNIFPIVATIGTKSSFLTYKRISVTPSYTKDKTSFEDSAKIQILITSKDYEQSVACMSSVFGALQNFKGTVGDTLIESIQMIDCSEDFYDESFVQEMIFEVNVNNQN